MDSGIICNHLPWLTEEPEVAGDAACHMLLGRCSTGKMWKGCSNLNDLIMKYGIMNILCFFLNIGYWRQDTPNFICFSSFPQKNSPSFRCIPVYPPFSSKPIGWFGITSPSSACPPVNEHVANWNMATEIADLPIWRFPKSWGYPSPPKASSIS